MASTHELTAMDKLDPKKQLESQQRLLSAVIVLFVVFSMVLTGFVGYEAMCVSQNHLNQIQINSDLREEINILRERMESLEELNFLVKEPGDADEIKKRSRREVISSNKVDLSNLLRGPPGPPGRDGRDGKDFASINLLRDVINETTTKEWRKLSATLPVYGGAVFIRWGSKSCPSVSKLVYRGQMTGPSFKSAGGGPNWQCLPDDPEYSRGSPNAYHSSLRAAHYRTDRTNLRDRRIPCVACETRQRVSQFMIPGKARCPSSDWTLEYRGYVAAPAEYNMNNNDMFTNQYFRGNYVCVDASFDTLTSKSHYPPRAGGQLFLVMAACTGNSALENCPPYKPRTALSCVVCSK